MNDGGKVFSTWDLGYKSPEALGVWQALQFILNIWGTAEPQMYFAQSTISLSFFKTVYILGKCNLCVLESLNPCSLKYCKVNMRSGFKKSPGLSNKRLFPLNSKVKFCQLWMNPEPSQSVDVYTCPKQSMMGTRLWGGRGGETGPFVSFSTKASWYPLDSASIKFASAAVAAPSLTQSCSCLVLLNLMVLSIFQIIMGFYALVFVLRHCFEILFLFITEFFGIL